jgi:hypothetical protein
MARRLSAYNQFVSQYMRTHKGEPKALMSAAAAAWRSRKSGSGLGRGMRRTRGRGFFGDVGNFFKGAANKVKGGFQTGYNYAKQYAPKVYDWAKPIYRPALNYIGNRAATKLDDFLPDLGIKGAIQGNLQRGINALGSKGGFGLRKKYARRRRS